MRASRNGLAHLLKLIRVQLDRERFGPWALITGAASGIGREFALQIAACGIHVAGSRCNSGRPAMKRMHENFRCVSSVLFRIRLRLHTPLMTRLGGDGGKAPERLDRHAVRPNDRATGANRQERNRRMKAALDKGQFGPWALVTGASSGIGKEFARQI